MSSLHASFLLLDDSSRPNGENSAAASRSSTDSCGTDFSQFSFHELYNCETPSESVMLNNCWQFGISEGNSKNKSAMHSVRNKHLTETPVTHEKLGCSIGGLHTECSLNACLPTVNSCMLKSGTSDDTTFDEKENNDCLGYTDGEPSSVTDTHSVGESRNTSCDGHNTQYVKDSEHLQLTNDSDACSFYSHCASKTNSLCSYPHQHESSQQAIKMKTKLKSLWENMKYGWRVKQQTSFKNDSPIWLLGKYYHTKLYDAQDEHESGSKRPEDVSKASFKEDLSSRIWLTYRYNFPALGDGNLTTDSGWGCMLRAGQMIMAQGLVCHFLGRDWHLSKDQTKLSQHRKIIRWFVDSPSPYSPFSIHKLVSVGILYGRKAGEWYGPAHIIHVLREALMLEREKNPEFQGLCVYATPDGIIFKQDIVDLCTSTQPEHSALSPDPFLNKTLLSQFSSDHPKSHVVHHVIKDCSSGPHSQKAKILDPSDKSCKIESLELSAKKVNNKKLFAKVPLKSHSASSEKVLCSKMYLCKMLQNTDLKQMSSPISTSEHDKRRAHCCDTSSFPIQKSPLSSNPVWKSVIIFVAVRLGNDRMNPFYVPSLKSLLAYEHCIGIIGGRPKHAVYFVGWHGNKLIHLDPHFCQPVEDVSDPNIKLKTYYSSSPCTMPFTDMDPSCAVGFYLKTKNEFEEFTEKIIEMSTSVKRNMEYPIFALSEGRRVDAEASCTTPNSFVNDFDGIEMLQPDEDDYIIL